MHTKIENPRQLIKEIEEESINIGYECTGPFLSLIAAEEPSYNAIRLLLNGPNCLKSIHKIGKIVSNSEHKPEFNPAIVRVFEANATKGACLFWNEYDYVEDRKCKHVSKQVQEAREHCLNVLNQ
jgi:hypothetical protein